MITGASAGVGRALARRYGDRGARVGLLARGVAGLEAAAEEVRERGGQALVVPTDVADAGQVDAAAARVEEAFGPIDVWVNNAMVTVMAHVWEVEPAEYRRVAEVNFLGLVHGTLTALRSMRARDRGCIIQVGSALAFRGIPGQAPYCATKHAVQGFTESLRAELLAEDSNVHVGMVHLPAVNTPQFVWSRNRFPNAPQPVAPIYQPDVAARAIERAADRHEWEVWVAGSTVLTVWGNRFAGRLVNRYLARSGVASQQTDLPADARPEDNLFRPEDADRDHGARGPFDEQANSVELASRLTSRRAKVFAATAAAVGAAAFAVGRQRRN